MDRNPFQVKIDVNINRDPGKYQKDPNDQRAGKIQNNPIDQRLMSRQRFNRHYTRSSVGPGSYYSEIMPQFYKTDPRISALGRDDIQMLHWQHLTSEKRNMPGPLQYQDPEKQWQQRSKSAPSFPKSEIRFNIRGPYYKSKQQLDISKSFNNIAQSPARILHIHKYQRNFNWNNLIYSNSASGQLDNGFPSSQRYVAVVDRFGRPARNEDGMLEQTLKAYANIQRAKSESLVRRYYGVK